MSPPAPLAAPLAAPLVALLTVAVAEISKDPFFDVRHHRQSREAGLDGSPSECLYEGHWHNEGILVPTRWACLHCACSAGALWCRRRACRPLSTPLPPGCQALHRPDACCPELHCPDGVTVMEYEAVENQSDVANLATTGHVSPACVEGGVVFAAGSALGGGAPCELCFCLGARRRCITPRCLPPPPGCSAGPARGACCPDRYHCERLQDGTATSRGPHDCKVGGQWVKEGERVPAVEASSNCTQCFCLHGAVRCQPLACAPLLRGCMPLLEPGQCCPHQYHCHHGTNRLKPEQLLDTSLMHIRIEDRSLHSTGTKPSKHDFTTKGVSLPLSTKTNKAASTITNLNRNVDMPTTEKKEAKYDYTTISREESVLADINVETTTTEQPLGSVRIVINESINCTAELSSTSLPLNITNNQTEIVKMQVQPRLPFIGVEIVEAQSFNPNEIITEGNADGRFDEDETFTVNVTTSLRTNNSQSTSVPTVSAVTKSSLLKILPEALNTTKKNKDDDYDYTDPTLPPSLPNLKIIPFLAADAVVENNSPSKVTMKYPVLDIEDKFPVYYSKEKSKDMPFVTKRDKMFTTAITTKYPLFNVDKNDPQHYPALSHEIDIDTAYIPSQGIRNDLLGPTNESTVSGSIGSQTADKNKVLYQGASTSSSLEIENHPINLFSPPSETEGGFVPKGPDVAGDYYSVYPSTPSGPSIPHLTTSMQLDSNKGECISGDGTRVAEGDSIALACSVCICVWGKMHCTPRPCHTRPGCKRLKENRKSITLCCGELICERVSTTALTSTTSTTTVKPYTKVENKSSSVKSKTENVKSGLGVEKNKSEINSSISNQDISTNIIKNGIKYDTNVTIAINSEKLNVRDASKTLNATEQLLNTTEKESTSNTSVLPTPPDLQLYKHTSNYAQEYEYDEEEGFSFGSVLQLLLGDRYDSTTAATKFVPPSMKSTTMPQKPTTNSPQRPLLTPFIPMRLNNQLSFPKTTLQQNVVNRIDHLILGEATAIKDSTPRSTATTALLPKPITSSLKLATASKPTSSIPITTQALEEPDKVNEITAQYTSVAHEGSRPPGFIAGGIGAGILKLAGCNIYGRMYRVGRIIAELSSLCQECRCTELGVQCTPLNCLTAD